MIPARALAIYVAANERMLAVATVQLPSVAEVRRQTTYLRHILDDMARGGEETTMADWCQAAQQRHELDYARRQQAMSQNYLTSPECSEYDRVFAQWWQDEVQRLERGLADGDERRS